MYTFKKLLQNQPVLIPLVQRDYAQGRIETHATRVREAIVERLKTATLQNEPLDFDFIYGAVRDGSLRPLDGQQRLTTLWLLYWYIGRYRQGTIPSYLNRFSFETRVTSRDFFRALCEYSLIITPSHSIRQVIENQKWFRPMWLHDPTVEGALVMLEELEKAFRDVETTVLPDLEDMEPNVTFQYLDLDAFQLDESLYIKMNSRGKQLTVFEHFKAQFEQMLITAGWEDEKEEFARKIELTWSDFLWSRRDSKTNTIDSAFLNLYRFISSTLAIKTGKIVTNEANEKNKQAKLSSAVTMPEQFRLLYDSRDTVRELFNLLDAWSTAEEMQREVEMYVDAIPLIESDLVTRLFSGTLSNEDRFILYAIYRLKLSPQHDNLTLVRILRNLIEGIRQNEQGVYKTNLRFDMFGALYVQIDRLIDGQGSISERLQRLGSPFNAKVIQHEKEKQDWIMGHRQYEEALCELENHPLLKGLTHRVFPTIKEYPDSAFSLVNDVLNASSALVSRAMLSIGDYALAIGNSNLGTRYVFGGDRFKAFVWTNAIGNEEQEQKKDLQPIMNQFLTRLLESTGSIEERLYDLVSNQSGDWDWRSYFMKYEGILTEKGHVFTFPTDCLYVIERLNGVNLQGSHINPLYLEIEARYPKVTCWETYYHHFSEMTIQGYRVYLDKNGKWCVEGKGRIDLDEMHDIVSSDEDDLVEQGVRLVRWLDQSQRVVRS